MEFLSISGLRDKLGCNGIKYATCFIQMLVDLKKTTFLSEFGCVFVYGGTVLTVQKGCDLFEGEQGCRHL